jgi:hypothetical protein
MTAFFPNHFSVFGGLPDSKGTLGIAVTIPTPAAAQTPKNGLSGKDTKKQLPVCRGSYQYAVFHCRLLLITVFRFVV